MPLGDSTNVESETSVGGFVGAVLPGVVLPGAEGTVLGGVGELASVGGVTVGVSSGFVESEGAGDGFRVGVGFGVAPGFVSWVGFGVLLGLVSCVGFGAVVSFCGPVGDGAGLLGSGRFTSISCPLSLFA